MKSKTLWWTSFHNYMVVKITFKVYINHRTMAAAGKRMGFDVNTTQGACCYKKVPKGPVTVVQILLSEDTICSNLVGHELYHLSVRLWSTGKIRSEEQRAVVMGMMLEAFAGFAKANNITVPV